MKYYRPQMVFTEIELGKNKDPQLYYRTIYTCPICAYKVSFNEGNFLSYSQNKVIKYKEDFHDIVERNFQSHLEFECPNCHRKTMVVFSISYGDKFPNITIDSVVLSS